MTIRNLDAILKPASVALIGASERPSSVGGIVARQLLSGSYGGRVMLVNPRHAELLGRPCFPDVAHLPEAPDLAVICTPPDTVPGLVADLGARGTRGAVVITAGFGEGGSAAGQTLRQRMLDAARPHLLRIVGPNCVGVIVPGIGLNATFGPALPRAGRLAFVSQSGAIMLGVMDWAGPRDIGFSHLVSIGDMSDVDFGDMLDYLALDPGTSGILLYVEAITHARKFMSAARAASRLKPVVVLKAGRHAEGARAAASHTGALAGSDAVIDAAFRRAGIVRVTALPDLFDAAEVLGKGFRIEGERIAILTNGGGFGVLATDALIDRGGRLAELSPATLAALDAALPRTWSRANPVDIIGDADGARYVAALAALSADPGVDAVLVLHCPTAVASPVEAAEAVTSALGIGRRVPVVACWVGASPAVAEARRTLAGHGLPVYETPDDAVASLMHLVHWRRSRDALMETPPSVPEDFRPDPEAARAVVARALAEGRDMLSEPEAKEVLAAYRVPVAATAVVADAAEAAARAQAMGFPVALKILSPDISHKSDVGGVKLDLESAEAVREAAEAMERRLRKAAPEARLAGFTVQEMVRRPGAEELIVGLSLDAQFGPVVLFGHGGTAVEVVRDRAIGLPPLTMNLARDLMERTRVMALLRGYRDRPAADLDAIAVTLIKVAQIAADLPEVAELDINPLLADRHGVCALDARIRVAPPGPGAARRLAIRPYPRELEESVELAGRRFLLRPIRPEDEPMLRSAFGRLSAEAVRMRFFSPLKALTHEMAARLTQIDYDREMALVLVDPAPAEAASLHAVVRISADPDGERAEFAITVWDELTGQGLGLFLMHRIIAYARRRGIGELVGTILRENHRMLAVCRELGFSFEDEEESGPTLLARLDLPGG